MTMKARPIRVLILSIGSLPIGIPSDKQFINDLIGHLPDSIIPALWTLNEAVPRSDQVAIGRRVLSYWSVNRFGHRPWCKGDEGLVVHRHNQYVDLFEVSISILAASFGSLRQAIITHDPHIIHFSDDLGPSIPLIKTLFPRIKITCTKGHVRVITDTGNLLYKSRIRMGLRSANRIIAHTNACKDNLQQAGIQQPITVIPWGALPPKPLPDERRRAIRSGFGCSDNDVLILASPRGTDSTLMRAIQVADDYMSSTASDASTKCVFSLKPNHDHACSKLATGRVQVMKSPPDFYDILESADALFAPQEKICRTVLPPLLWFEAMMRGTPVVTEFNPGIEDVIEDGVTGILFNGWECAQDALKKLLDQNLLIKMKREAREATLGKYNISQIADTYADLWSSLA